MTPRTRVRAQRTHSDGARLVLSVVGAGPVAAALVDALSRHEQVAEVRRVLEPAAPSHEQESPPEVSTGPSTERCAGTGLDAGTDAGSLVVAPDPLAPDPLVVAPDPLAVAPDPLAPDALVVAPDASPALAEAAVAAAAAPDSHVPVVVLVTSAEVYGARPDNSVPLREDGPLRAEEATGRLGDLLELEALAARAAQHHPQLTVTVLRPAALVGLGSPGPLAGHFSAPWLLVVRGTRPLWQFCHLEDLAAAVVVAADGRVPGVATVASEGWLEQHEVEQLTGLRRVELPAGLAFGTADRLSRLGVVPGSGPALAYVVHPWVVASERLRQAGWRSQHDNVGALRTLRSELDGAGPRFGARDATLASAGAAVAVVGTAALVRAARRRRRA